MIIRSLCVWWAVTTENNREIFVIRSDFAHVQPTQAANLFCWAWSRCDVLCGSARVHSPVACLSRRRAALSCRILSEILHVGSFMHEVEVSICGSALLSLWAWSSGRLRCEPSVVTTVCLSVRVFLCNSWMWCMLIHVSPFQLFALRVHAANDLISRFKLRDQAFEISWNITELLLSCRCSC